MKFSDAIRKFDEWRGFKVGKSTVRGYNMVLRQFCVFMRDCEIEKIALDDIIGWFGLMRSLEWKSNSFIPKAIALRKFFEFYLKQGLEVVDPWLIPVPDKQYRAPRVATEKDYSKLLEVIPRDTNDPRHIRNLAIVNLLWDTGARNGEVVSINCGDIVPGRMKAVIKTEKSKGFKPVRQIFWTKETEGNLLRWMDKRKSLAAKSRIDPDALFVSVCGGGCHNNAGNRFAIKGVGEMLRRYSKKAGISNLNAHSFRHHMGHDLVAKGANNSVIANILGHSSLNSSFAYTMMNNMELEEKYREMKGR